MSDSFKPRNGAYLRMMVGRVDGMLEIDVEQMQTFLSEDEAISSMQEEAEDGSEWWLYRLVPVARVSRGTVKVTRFRS